MRYKVLVMAVRYKVLVMAVALLLLVLPSLCTTTIQTAALYKSTEGGGKSVCVFRNRNPTTADVSYLLTSQEDYSRENSGSVRT